MSTSTRRAGTWRILTTRATIDGRAFTFKGPVSVYACGAAKWVAFVARAA